MKKIVMRVKKQTALLKTLFIFSVLIIVAGELLSISKTISFNQLEEIFQSIPVWKIVIMLIVGLAAVIPMFGYDITLNRMLQNKMKPSYLLETSWMINSINNIAGFGGIINIGLRTAFFRKKNSGKKVAQSLSKIVIFLLSGLSIWSFLSFLLVFFWKTKSVPAAIFDLAHYRKFIFSAGSLNNKYKKGPLHWKYFHFCKTAVNFNFFF